LVAKSFAGTGSLVVATAIARAFPKQEGASVMGENVTRPLILVRGFGGLDVSSTQRSPYQGFNDGTVYPGRKGENYIYEGFLLRCLKSDLYPYRDATNVVGYYAKPTASPAELENFEADAVERSVVMDAAIEDRVLRSGVSGTIWIYRYYDLSPRQMVRYGAGLARLISLIESAATRRQLQFDGVDIVAHSMGGLVVRQALRALDATTQGRARKMVHRIVTLGTPHRGISFQRMPNWMLDLLPGLQNTASDELKAFDPTETDFLSLADVFDTSRILTVVGTNHAAFGNAASFANRLSSLLDEGTLAYNRSDGLVKHSAAQLPGAPRTFIHKSHGGEDSLVTSREAYEISMRFFHGSHKVKLRLALADISRGGDWFSRSEFYLGVSIKPRGVDFALFDQSTEAENCYGPFRESDLSDALPDLAEELKKSLAELGDRTTGWAGPDRLIWEGWIDSQAKPEDAIGLVFRLDIYLGERDSFGLGFSDNVVFRKQYYVQAIPGSPELYVHTGEKYLSPRKPTTIDSLRAIATSDPSGEVQVARPVECRDPEATSSWDFRVHGTGFDATFNISLCPA
jgi:pimeloyl-ACP methyl ester carboxylesterase